MITMEMELQGFSPPFIWVLLSLSCMAMTWTAMTLATPVHFFIARFWIPRRYGLDQTFLHQPANCSAVIHADEIVAALMDQEEFMEYLLPEKIGQQILRVVMPHMEEYVDELFLQLYPSLWPNLPRWFKNRIYAHANAKLPFIVDDVLDHLRDEIDQFIDFRELVIESLQDKPQGSTNCYQAETRPLRNFSAWLATPLCLLLSAFLMTLEVPWAIVISSLLGVLISIALAFKIKLPAAVSHHSNPVHDHWVNKISDHLSMQLLSLPNLAHILITGKKSARFKKLLRQHLLSPSHRALLTKLSQAAVHTDQPVQLFENRLIQQIFNNTEFSLNQKDFVLERRIAIKNRVSEALNNLSEKKFSQLLNNLWKAHKHICLVLGSILGAADGIVLQQIF